MTEPYPKRWHVYLVNINPQRGTKPGKFRPCLVIQNEAFNYIGSSIFIPITSKTMKDSDPIRVNIPIGVAGLIKSSDLMIDQMLSWDHTKIISHIGELPSYLVERTKTAIKEFMDLD